MTFKNNSHLRKYLTDSGMLALVVYESFELEANRFELALAQVRAQHPYLEEAEAAARATFRVIARAGKKGQPKLRTRKRLGIRFWLIVAAIVVAGLLAGVFCTRLHAEPTLQNLTAYRNALRGASFLPMPAAPQQPSGIIIQFRNAGSTLATRPAGLIIFDCGANMSCSFSGSTFTLTSTGGAGGCAPPGTSGRFLYDNGSGGCLDSAFTWNNSTSTATAPTGVTVTYSGSGIINARNWAGTAVTNTESLGKIPIGNGDGTATWSDPFVSGITAHDAVATSTNPVLIGGYASAAAPVDVSNDGDAVRAWLLRNGSQVFNLAAAGALIPGDGTNGLKVQVTTAPTTAVTQSGAWSLTANQSVNVAQFGGANSVTGTGASGAGIPRVTFSNDSKALLWDGTNTEAIKAASTSAVATDPSAVVQISPNQPQLTTPLNMNVAQWMGSTAPSIGQKTSANSIPIVGASDWVNTVIGNKSDNGAASGADRVTMLPGIYRTNGAGGTSGRNSSMSQDLAGFTLSSVLPEPSFASYSASKVVASAATATDISVLSGNASTTVLVTEIRVTCTQTTAGNIELHIAKRSSADTAGTSSGMTAVPDDSNYPAASSAALVYTANPTTGTGVGDVDVVKLGCMATGTAVPNDIYIGNFRQKPIILRGTAQQLAVNLNSATVTGGSFAITYKWIESTGI